MKTVPTMKEHVFERSILRINGETNTYMLSTALSFPASIVINPF